jgi:peptidyl-prolyl cis-trans isomerase B (cyclophilin B)
MRQQERQVERVRKIRKRTGIGAAACVVAGLIAGIVLLVTSGGGKSEAAAKATPTATATASPTSTASAISEPAHHCTYTKASPAAKTVSLPSATPDYTASYQATFNTNRGKIVINLLNSKATCTVNSFVHLAEAGFWNNSQCHRMSNGQGLYILQCGDPYATATTKLTCSSTSKVGTGGPGYEFASENLAGAKYDAGTVAMANDGTADSNGSQFFLVFKNTSLPADYTPFGTITSGLDIVQNVAKDGYSCQYASAGGGAPKERVIIDSVTIKKT